MAPSRGKGKGVSQANFGGTATTSPRPLRSLRRTTDAVPDVYHEMLVEAAVADPVEIERTRPLKRRRVAASIVAPGEKRDGKQPVSSSATPINAVETDEEYDAVDSHNVQGLQRIETSSEDSDETDLGFEDVNLDQPAASSPGSARRADPISDVSISLESPATLRRRAHARRKPASTAEKAHRLLVHKAHVLCLLGHCMYVNSWCNNETVHQQLIPVLSERTVSYLNPKTSDSQFQQDRSFMDGLKQAEDAFRAKFKITTSGIRRSNWSSNIQDDVIEDEYDPVCRSDFITAAGNLKGSQDTGNQLFCALLRSVGVEVRLVCSLQPFVFGHAAPSTPRKPVKPTVLAIAQDVDPIASDVSTDDASIVSSKIIGKVPSVRRRLGQPSFASEPAATSTPTKKRPIRKLSYPIFWIEAFNAALQKWIPVDPVVTQTVNKASKIEPPSSYEFNQLSYAIAMESTGVAKDVTRRYAKAYNAKTRRLRIEATEGGAQWLKRALRLFRRRGPALDRDQVEDAELAQKEGKEGMPNNVQDFKHHPYYALERHLRRHEIIHPRREIGRINAGTAVKPRLESVFRRQDVLICRSADRWYRLGRTVKEGEQPLKHITSRLRRAKDVDKDNDEETADTVPLYAPSQTELYVPTPVVRGRVPKNAYGNLDVYVPSMVPAGGIHIRHKLAQGAAKVLKVDYADAVTGFQFKGRHGTAIVEGAVVAQEFAEAVEAVIDGLTDVQQEGVSMARSLVALRLWKRFLTGLRIAERISTYGPKGAFSRVKERLHAEEGEQEELAQAGGFLPAETEETVMPTAGHFTMGQLMAPLQPTKHSKRPIDGSEEEHEADVDQDEPGENVQSEHGDGERGSNSDARGFMPHVPQDADFGVYALPNGAMADGYQAGGFLPEYTTDGEGREVGFVPEANATTEEVGSGFLPLDDAAEEVFGPDSPKSSNESGEMDREEEPSDVNLRIATLIDGARPARISGRQQATKVERTSWNEELAYTMPEESSIKHGSVTCPGADVTREQEEASDHGSMISHDPEDEDAEPDWLESD